MSAELFIVTVLRVFVEIAMFSLLGQGVVALLAGAGREQNPIYRVFTIITGPAVRMVRFITPKMIIDKHLPFVAFFILFWLWIVLAYIKRSY